MEYERKYQNRINWQNTPSMSTPLNATNLNKMDVALQYMDGKLAEASGDIVSIEANPSGTATSNLTKLKVDSTIYDVGSYTAGTGINIVNGAIHNTETGARSGIIDSISSSRAHTQIMLATNETFKAYETLILKSETSGSASTLRVQYASSASSVYDYNLYDTDGTTAKTLNLESGQIIIVMLDQTGYKAIVLSDGIGGGDSYSLVGMGKVQSYSNKLANTNVYLHRAPKDGDRLFIWFPTEVTDSDAQVKIYDEASGTAYTLGFSFWASGWKLYGLCLLGIADDGLGNLGLSLLYNFEGGTNYSAGTGIDVTGSVISNTAPNYGVNVDGQTISSVSSGALGYYVGESKYLIMSFSANATPYSGGYTLTLSYSGAVAIQKYGALYDGSSRYNENISAGTMLICEVTDTGTGTSADPIHVNVIGVIDSNGGGMPENPLATNHGGTGNADGFIRTGAQSGSTVGTSATIEGYNNIASGNYSHAEGHSNTVGANAHDSHAEGQNNTVNGAHSHVSGSDNVAGYSGQTVIGVLNNNKANTIFEVGDGTSNARKNAFEVYGQGYGISTDDGNTKIRFGKDSNGNYGYYKGNDNTLNLFNQGGGGLPEDPLSITHGGTGNSAGYIQTGRSTQSALGTGATIEGHNNTGAGTYCHAEGYDNSCGANASYSHVEGQSNSVSGTASHAEGYACSVSGNYSHAGGYYSTVGYQNQTAVGKYNNNKSGTLFEVGNGTSTSARNNAFEVYSDGKISCDNGASKFQFTQNNGSDGYYDASGIFHAFGGGSGNTVSKTRYQISSSSWSSSPNADGYYTLTTTLNPAIGSSPDVYVAGSADGTQPTDTQKTQFSYVKRCKVNGSTLTLYASSKPSSTFYIWVEGVNGTGSGDIVGNVIQPNGASGGSSFVTGSATITFSASDWTAWGSLYYADKTITTPYDLTGKKVFIASETTASEIGIIASCHIVYAHLYPGWSENLRMFVVRFVRPTVPSNNSTTIINYMITD